MVSYENNSNKIQSGASFYRIHKEVCDMNKILLTNIQRFSLHDGPGIRTTVFLKGCSLRCPWCSNPENLNLHPQKYIKNGVKGIYGTEYSCDELYDEVNKDKAFYDGDWNSAVLDKMPGGVTFSGGECMLQMDRLEPLLERLNEEQIHTAVETCLFAPTNLLTIAINHINLFYVDIKILDEELCKSTLCGDLSLYHSNFQTLLNFGKQIVFRIPVIGGYTDGDDNRRRVVELIKNSKGNILKIELIKEHNLGTSKYQSLIDGENDIKLPVYSGVSDDLMEQYKKEIQKVTDVPVEVCKI
jgi:pyruvate formate lyase activating enzyme